jgi:hypothetical protein
MGFENIPAEMRCYQQWICWRFEDRDTAHPTKVPYNVRTGKLASVSDANSWVTFNEAVIAADHPDWYDGIGFVLTENDPYAFIDLDNPKGDSSILDRQVYVYNEFKTYAERSPSGTGLHLIVKGSVPSGRRRSSIEIYSAQRYMTMTGDVYRVAEIGNYNDQLLQLWTQMGNGNLATAVYAGLIQEKETDEVICTRAAKAANGDKFLALYNGDWFNMYPSQSEADFALINIVAFYTQCRKQISRIFLNSALGRREKAKRVDYLNYMLNKCFDRMLPPVDIEGLQNQIREALEKKELPTIAIIENPIVLENKIELPMGLVGELAQFIYAQAPRPVPEIALAGALGLLSGVVGRAYNVSNTGLNQYVLLLAPTGTGKEAISSGVDKLISAVIRTVPGAIDFIGPGEIASGQALIRYISKSYPSFVSMLGEFGLTMQQMARIDAPPHLVQMRKVLLDIYMKSGEGKIFRPSAYSNAEKNIGAIQSPSFTLMGESTPEKFYEGLHEGLIAEGLLPRFVVLEYHGNRPDLNKAHALVQPSFSLIEKFATICSHCLMLNSQNKAIHIKMNAEADQTFDAYDKYCTSMMNHAEREIRKHLWNRAHLKAVKIAALIAVGCNPYEPTIDMHMTNYAINMIMGDVTNMLARFESGKIGINLMQDESRQIEEIINIVKEWILRPWEELKKYGAGSQFLHQQRVLPYSFVHRRAASINVFRKDRIGENGSIKRTILTLIEKGDLQELNRATVQQQYNTTAKCFMISNLKSFGIE